MSVSSPTIFSKKPLVQSDMIAPPAATDAFTATTERTTQESPAMCGASESLDAMMGIELDDEPPVGKTPQKKSGIFGASSNLVNSIVGAGIIGIPYALGQAGLVAGVFLLLLVAYLTDKSLRMIVELASFHPALRTRGVATYEDLASYPFGRLGTNFVLLNMFVLAYGAMVAYLLIIKDTIPTILGVGLGYKGGFERELILISTSLVIVVPLSIQRDMASLAFTSFLSVLADAVLVVFITAYSPIKETVSDAGGFESVLKTDWINGTLFIGLGILSTAMACQHSAFIVSGSLANKTRARWAAVTYRSIFIAAVLCAVLGICGYLGFLGETEGDILNNFPADSIQANVARGLLAVTMFLTYPMEAFVARHVLMVLVFNGDMEGESEGSRCSCLGRRIRWTLILYVMTLIPALIVDDLGPVLSITGSLGGSCIAYIAPGMLYLGVNGEAFLAGIGRVLDNYRRKGSTDGQTGDIELPVAGDADRVISEQATPTFLEGRKPWWWYPLGLPIWCGIASTGSVTMKQRLAQETESQASRPSSENLESEDDVLPSRRDYVIAIFFIVFGVVAAVAGLVSNIYVQISGTFFAPK